jgi:hypothetical protein
MGYPLDSFKYFLFEIHYTNFDLIKNLKDTAGIKMYVTKNYRPIEFGIATIGADVQTEAAMIPPKSNNLTIEYQCASQVSMVRTKMKSNIVLFKFFQYRFYYFDLEMGRR